MKKIISLLMATVIAIGCLPITTFAAYNNGGKAYSENTDEVYFSSGYAQVGVPISVKVKESDTDILYKWYINGDEISNSGDSYTPVEADLESMLTAEAYGADGEKIGAANMLISKLPVIYIETKNREQITVKGKVLKAHMKIQGNSEFNDASVLYDGETDIKGRGNSTWLANKKPYKLKLASKSNLLGMGKNKHWVLLSNPYDKTLLRNKLTYDLAEEMGLDTMSSQWVDVVFNGKVVGNYLLCEHVRIGSTRVDITNWDDIAEDVAKAIYKANKKSMSKDERDELSALMEDNMNWVTDGSVTYKGKTYKISDYYELPSANGGYLLECFGSEKPRFVSKGGYGVCISKPEGIGKGMLSEIQAYYSAFEEATQAEDFCAEYNGKKVRYSELADAESFAKGILFNEIFHNQDFLRDSTYMYKDVDGKLIFGPVWDMDISADNSSYIYPHNSWVCFTRGNILKMLRDPAFLKLVYDAYREYRYTIIEKFVMSSGDIDTAHEKIYESGIANDMLWNTYASFEDDTENLKLWLSRRLDWIDSQTTSFETFYSSVNGTKLNNSGSTMLELNGSQLEITMNDTGITACKVLVNGTEVKTLSYNAHTSVNLGTLAENSVVSVMSYDVSGNFLGMSTVTSYNEPVSLKMTKAPTKNVYNSGDKIELNGLELKAVYADGSEKTVQPESALSYVEDCMGAQESVYNEITDKIGNTYISLRYRGLKADYKINKNPNEDAEKVAKLIEMLPVNDFEDNLEIVFNAKQEYDALSDTAKKKVTNFSKLEAAMKKINELSKNSDTPILGCYIDRYARVGQKNKVVVIAKGKPNKIRFFIGGSTTTIPVANRDYCISEKQIAGYNVMTIVYYLGGSDVDVGAYYNHIQKGEFYHFNVKKAIENRSGMIKNIRYNKSTASAGEIAELNVTVNNRVEMLTATCDGLEFAAVPENGKAALEITPAVSGLKNIEISYIADGELHEYKTVPLYVREKKADEAFTALKFPSATAEDTADVFAAVSQSVKSVKLVSKNETLIMKSAQKNGFKIWQCNVKMDSSKSYRVYVDSKDIGRTVNIQKLDKLVIENGRLVECRVKNGNIDIPYGVTSVADGAFKDFTGTVYCYKNSAAQGYAEKNGLKFVNYGYTINIPDEIKMKAGESVSFAPIADPVIAPDFGMTITADNASLISQSGNGFKANKAGYARVTVKCNDGMSKVIKLYIGGGCTKGDVNADGVINSADALLILRNTVGLIEFNEDEKNAANVNTDGIINSLDALIVLQITTGISSIWDFV